MKQAPTSLPRSIEAAYQGWNRELVYAPYMYATWRLTSEDGRLLFAKAAFEGVYPSISAERDRMVWARQHLPVPEVLDHGVEDGMEWMLTAGLPGVDASKLRHDAPERVVRALGEALRDFHDAPANDCPFDFTLVPAIAHCTARVEAGRERWDDLHDDFKHHTPQSALAELIATKPSSEDVVVCHGDYCFPNMLLQDGKVTGFLDLGELGLADRWWDIAVGAWSVTWNVDPSLEPLFYDAYGVKPDPDRIRFYRLMYDLAS